MRKVSVIIPIYNVGSFIERCAVSLLNQTLIDVEFIFVDDASSDNSVEKLNKILDSYPERNGNCILIRHSENRGLPSARNSGLEVASGQYIFHCDGDDWLEPSALELLYNCAVENSADFVWCDFFISYANNERYMKARDYSSPDELLRKGFFSGDMKYNVWNKLISKEIYDNSRIRFPDGHSMGEDMTIMMLAGCSNKVAYVPQALYHYVKTNPGAYTQSVSITKYNDIKYNGDRVISWFRINAPGKFDEAIQLFKLNLKLPFLITADNRSYQLWKEWYPEANSYIFKNMELPFRTKLLQWFASKNLWLFVRLYYELVYRFGYRLLYK